MAIRSSSPFVRWLLVGWACNELDWEAAASWRAARLVQTHNPDCKPSGSSLKCRSRRSAALACAAQRRRGNSSSRCRSPPVGFGEDVRRRRCSTRPPQDDGKKKKSVDDRVADIEKAMKKEADAAKKKKADDAKKPVDQDCAAEFTPTWPRSIRSRPAAC